MLAFITYTRVSQFRNTAAVAAGLMLVVGLATAAALSKETGLMVLPVCVVFDFVDSGLLYDRRGGAPVFARATALGGFVVAFMAARLWLQGGPAPVWYGPTNPAANADAFVTRVLSFAYIDWFHFSLLLLPTAFCPDWRGSVPLVESMADPNAWIAITFFSGLGFAAWRCFTRRAAAAEAIGWAWLCLPFIPASNVFFYVGFTVAERVTYTPSFGFCLLLSIVAVRFYRRRPLGAIATAAALIAAYSAGAAARDREWGNPKLLWESAVQTCPNNFVSHVLLGNIYDAAGEKDKALKAFETSLEHNPAYLIAHLNIGRIRRDRQEFSAAAASLEQALLSCDTKQTCGIVRNGLGLVYSDLNDWSKAVENYRIAHALVPSNDGWRQQMETAEHILGQQPVAAKPPSDTPAKVRKPEENLEAKRAKMLRDAAARLTAKLHGEPGGNLAVDDKDELRRELAAVHAQLGDHRTAAEYLKAVLDHSSKPTFEIVVQYATTVARAGDPELGITTLRETKSQWPSSWIRTLYEIGTIHRDNRNDKASAAAAYHEVLELADAAGLPDTAAMGAESRQFLAKTLVNLGVFDFENDNRGSAIRRFEAALRSDPSHEIAKQNLKALKQ